MTNPTVKNDLMDKVLSLCKRRGFVFPGSEIYGGMANSWDYGPLGTELKKNVKDEWWSQFVRLRSDMVGIDAAIIMNPKVWEASGHTKEFSDPLVECKECHARFRGDQIDLDDAGHCPNCKKGILMTPKQFNLLFKTNIGPVEESSSEAFMRGEIAQAMFINFKNVLDTAHKRLPFGIASQGRAFRNEITPGNFIFRTREFDLMEFEYFVEEKDWEKWFEYWRGEMRAWIKHLGVSEKNVYEVEVAPEDRAHYSKKTVDFEYAYPFGQKELYGLAYRTDFDLKNHMEKSGADLNYLDPETNQKFIPHVIEPSFGLDRSLLVMLLEAYTEDKENGRVYLKLPKWSAPYKVAVFPLLGNKPLLTEKAKRIYDELLKHFPTAWDDRGNVGKRYYSQDEIGTPFCVTVDFDTLEKDDCVTVRDRDTMKQERVKTGDLTQYLSQKLKT